MKTLTLFALISLFSFGIAQGHVQKESTAKTIEELPKDAVPNGNDKFFPLYTDSNGVLIIDVTSIKLVDGKASFFISLVTKKDDEVEVVVTKQQIDCVAMKSTYLYIYIFDRDGKILASDVNPDDTIVITPGTRSASIASVVCKAPGTPTAPVAPQKKHYPAGTETV